MVSTRLLMRPENDKVDAREYEAENKAEAKELKDNCTCSQNIKNCTMKSSETIAITESHKKVNKHPGSQYRYYFVLCNNPHQYLHEAVSFQLHHAQLGHGVLEKCEAQPCTPPCTGVM